MRRWNSGRVLRKYFGQTFGLGICLAGSDNNGIDSEQLLLNGDTLMRNKRINNSIINIGGSSNTSFFRKIFIFGLFLLPAFFSNPGWGLNYFTSATYGPNGVENVGNSAVVDQEGNIFVAGYLYSDNSYKFSIVKFNPQLIFSSSFTIGTADGLNYANAIALDSTGNVFATGFIKNSDTSFNNLFVVKLTNDLVLISSFTKIPPVGWHGQGTGISVASDGSVYVAGYSMPTGIGAYSSRAGFIGHFDQTLVLLNSAIEAPLGRPGILTRGENVYVTGATQQGKVWLGKYTSTLDLLSSTAIPTINLSDHSNAALGIDQNENVFISGTINNMAWIGKFDSSLVFVSSISEPTASIFESLAILPDGSIVAAEDDKSKIFKFSPNLSLISASYGFGDIRGLASDLSGNIYVSGYRYSLLSLSKHPALVAPSSFTGIALSSTSIRWSWTDVIGESSYQVFSNTREALSEDLSADTLFWIENGLLPNTSYTRYVVSKEGQESHESMTSAVVTLGLIQPITTPEIPTAYPNPFRPGKGHTAMSIDNLPETGTLKLFTLKGELVREIPVAAGSASWDVKNTAGETVSSGVYFGVVDGQDSDKTFKVVIQR